MSIFQKIPEQKFLQALAIIYGLVFVGMAIMLSTLSSIHTQGLAADDAGFANYRLYAVMILSLVLAITLWLKPALGVIFLHGFALLYIAFAFMGKAPFADYGVAFHVVALLIYWKIVIRKKRSTT